MQPLEAHGCSEILDNAGKQVSISRAPSYPDYVAHPDTAFVDACASGNLEGWSRIVPVLPEGASAIEVLRAHRDYADAGFQTHFYRPPDPEISRNPDLADPEIEIDGPSEGSQPELFCSRWATVGHCDHGHTYAKELICNREWCSECGGTDGKAHQRRKSKWLPRLRQMSRIGYMVITIPPELREDFRTKDRLREFGISIRRLMQREGYHRGLRRYHWFGEDHQGSGLQGDGLPVYHPHLNLLFEAGWIDDLCPDEDKASGEGCRGPGACLSRIKRSVGRILGVDLARVNVYYEYATDVPQMLHLMNYVLRPTFSDWSWDERLGYEIHGFRHTEKWGKWDGEAVWDLPDSGDAPSPEIESLVHGLCPIDESPITWNPGVMNTAILRRGREVGTWAELGEGYWAWSGLVRAGPRDTGEGS